MRPATSSEAGDRRAVRDDLRARVRGPVRFDKGSRALYATDGSNYRQVPIGVVVPKDRNDLLATIEVARRYGLPILPRGGGTSLAGQCCNEAIVMDCSRFMNRVLDVDPGRRLARVEPGTVLDDLRKAAERYHLTFAPDPATHNHCTLGGMLGNNSCGIHSVMGGKTVDNVERLEVVTPDGEILSVGATSEDELGAIIAAGGRRGEIYQRLRDIRDRYGDEIRRVYPDIPRRVSGYNLDQLLPENGFHVARALVGTEGTCVTVLEATLQLVESPPGRALAVLGFSDVYQAADMVPEVLRSHPIGLEGMDDRLIRHTRSLGIHPDALHLLPQGGGWLIAEYGGADQEAAAEAAGRVVREWTGRDGCSPKLVRDHQEQEKIWSVRESGLAATSHPRGQDRTWPGWEDSAVPPEKLGQYLRQFRKLLDSYGYHGSLYGHFGDGCLHVRIDFDLERRPGIERYLSFTDEAADLVLSMGGSFSGEHGDGQARGPLLQKMFGAELMNAFREFKLAWDPENRMNPGKVPVADARDSHLRLGAGLSWQPGTHFQFPEEQGEGFAGAALRCVGVGECRRHEGGTMCPSYMVTREEQHSTRGRARLLFEMLKQDVIGGHGWHDHAVHDALDLCLACKGCKGDCPVRVDMATYKAEFLSHYYAGRLRPRSAYAFGFIYRWASLARFAPGIINFLGHAPGFRTLARWMAGVDQRREIPRFAPVPFTEWFRGRRSRREGGSRVLLWPDTFTNHFHPEVGRAAVEVLETAGFQVVLPRAWVCCGRPLYDYGFLHSARQRLRHSLEVLEPELEAGVPVVGLEPSCVSVFRDELTNFFPDDPAARHLGQNTFTLAEFLTREGYDPPRLEGTALLHGHCHQKALMGIQHDRQLLESLGLAVEAPDTGCCGMAGGFGFERDHYEVSVACGERVLLPAVRESAADTLVVADGFSCREQVRQLSRRRALHLAEVLWMAGHPERRGSRPALTVSREE